MNRKNPSHNETFIDTDKDDLLFESLGKTKKRKKRKILRTVTIIVVILAFVIFAGTFFLQRRIRDQFASQELDVLACEVTTGSISTLVSGSGTLQNMDPETVTVPEGVEVLEIIVSKGSTVDRGSLIATVDTGTVKAAMADRQDAIEELDDQLSDAEGDQVSAYIRAGVAGRVKHLYADTNTSVTDVMAAHGALAMISLDGFMAVDLETTDLAANDAVTVLLSDGSEIEGTVSVAGGGKATVLLSDNGPKYGETVQVFTEQGCIGTGKLYIHEPLAVTGYAGTVSWVNAKENQKVYASSILFTLKDRSTRANYDTLLRQRKQEEEGLLELLQIQRMGGIISPVSGSVYSLSAVEDSSENAETDQQEIAVISPDVSMSVTITVDESDILSLSAGQTATVTVRSLDDASFSGVVTEIDKSGTGESYTAVVQLDKAAGMLQGMTASVEIRITGVDDALIIPVDALNQTASGAYVYTSYDEETQEYGGRVDVTTGLSNSQYVQIKSGLRDGDTVYYTEKQAMNNMFDQFAGGNRNNAGGQMPGFGEAPNRSENSGERQNPNAGGNRPNRG